MLFALFVSHRLFDVFTFRCALRTYQFLTVRNRRCCSLLSAGLVAYRFMCVPFGVVVEVGVIRSSTVDVVGGSVVSNSR